MTLAFGVMDVGWRRKTLAMDGSTTNAHTTTAATFIRRDKGVKENLPWAAR
jgi:hypothetical protein